MNDYYSKFGYRTFTTVFRFLAFILLLLSAFEVNEYANEVVGITFDTVFYRTLFMFAIPLWIEALIQISSPVWRTGHTRKATSLLILGGYIAGFYIFVISMVGFFAHGSISGHGFWALLCIGSLMAASIFVLIDLYIITDLCVRKYRKQKTYEPFIYK